MGERPRIVISNDNALLRGVLRDALGETGQFEIVGEAGDGDSTLQVVAEVLPDVLISDIRKPAPDGVAVTARLAVLHPSVAVVLLTAYHQRSWVARGIHAGARSYLRAGGGAGDLVAAVHHVAAGGHVYDRLLLDRLLSGCPVHLSKSEAQPLKSIIESGSPASRLGPRLTCVDESALAALNALLAQHPPTPRLDHGVYGPLYRAATGHNLEDDRRQRLIHRLGRHN